MPRSFDLRQIGIHVLYWIFYLLFFTVQRYSFEGYENFPEIFLMNLAFLPDVIILTYVIVELLVPRIFFSDRVFLPVVSVIAIVIFDAFIAYLSRVYFVEPYILDDNIPYSISNTFAAILSFVFAFVPPSALKVSRRIQADYMKHKEVEQEKLEAELKLRESELKLLKGQIQPHFLFNTLNNIYSLSVEKSSKTPDMILRLSDMLSYVTYDCNADRIELSRELNFILSYIELQKIRYDSFDIETTISGEIEEEKIAPMILHPFLDMAFRNSLTLSPVKRWIRITVSCKEHILTFSVIVNTSDPDGLTNSDPSGTELEIARRRLDLLYRQRNELKLNRIGNTFSLILKLHL